MTEQTETKLDTWAIVEIMGHTRIAGRITETTLAGGVFLRIDVPEAGDRRRAVRPWVGRFLCGIKSFCAQTRQHLLSSAGMCWRVVLGNYYSAILIVR